MNGDYFKKPKKERLEIIKDQLDEIMVELERKRIDRNLIYDYTKQCQFEIKELEKNF